MKPRVLRWAGSALLMLTVVLPSHAGFGTWTSSGPPGGQVTDSVSDPSAPDTAYAATLAAGSTLSELAAG